MSITVSDVRAEVSIDTDPLRQGEREVQASTGRISDMFHSLGSGAAAVAIGTLVANTVGKAVSWARDALSGMVSDMVNTNAQFEMFTAQFDVLLGSHEQAIQRMKELERFAVATPFNLDEIIRADQTLQNFGLHSQAAAEAFGYSGRQIRVIAGDVAAGTRASFDEVSLILGRFAAGDTGQAIMRMQELGIVTRDQLRRMGVEFSQSGQLLSPLPEAMSVILQLMEEKYGGLMEVESKTLQGMQSNWQDWKTNMKRQLGEPLFDAVKDQYQGLLDLLGSEAMGEAMSVLTDAIRWAVEGVTGLLGDLGSFVAPYIQQAFSWGANIVEQFAAGITGSGALADALRGLGDQIMYWLMPGSPPRIARDLDQWGMGAAEAYFQGWAHYTPEIGPWLRDMYKSLQPHLEEIGASGMFGADQRGRLREAFGDQSQYVEEVAASYADLVSAARRAAEAQEALDEARGTGDEDAIGSAQERLDLAADEETQARRNYAEAQGRMTAKMRQEAQLKGLMEDAAKATIDRARAEGDAAAKAAQREAEAEAKRQAAEAKRLHDAKLAYELAMTDTAGQIAIMRRELAGVEEESVEYYQILTRIAGLEKSLAAERKRGGAGAGGAGWGGAGMDEVVEETKEESQRLAFDFKAAGARIGQLIKEGIIGELALGAAEGLLTLSEKFLEWAISPAAREAVMPTGEKIGEWVGMGLAKLFGLDKTREDFEDDVTGMLAQATENMMAGVGELGKVLGEAFFRGLVRGLTGQPVEEHVGKAMEEARDQEVDSGNIWNRLGREYGDWWWSLPDWITGGRDATSDWFGGGTTPAPSSPDLDYNYDIEIHIDARGANADEVERGVVDGLRKSGVMP